MVKYMIETQFHVTVPIAHAAFFSSGIWLEYGSLIGIIGFGLGYFTGGTIIGSGLGHSSSLSLRSGMGHGYGVSSGVIYSSGHRIALAFK